MYFAWHQQDDQVIFAAFDPRGEVLMAPEVIGKGRWPRLAADGQRTAVAWNRADGFAVRVNDGKQWGEEIQLAGGEAAIAFGLGGLLYAATSTGLWKLTENRFERVQEASYSQPALVLDKDGHPHVAWRQGTHIVYDGSDVGEGERPSVAIAQDGTVQLAHLSKGALVIRSLRDGQWTSPEIVPATTPSWPTLALGGDGLRLTYIGAADHGPDALWLVRLPDKQPIMLPSLAGNVTDAWLTVTFQLHDVRSNYRPHDVQLTVNGVEVKRFENTVPEGRYVFRLDPYQIFTSAGQPVANRVAIHSRHMNGGHYSSNSEYHLIVHTPWSERYAFAANQEEVLHLPEGPGVNHDKPDLAVFANAMDLPVEMPKPGRMDLPVTIANLGEADSGLVGLVMRGGRKVLAEVQVQPLKPGGEQVISMPFDYDGKMQNVSFELKDNVDFDRSNDSMTLSLWAPKTPFVPAGPTAKVPTEVQPNQVTPVKLASGVRIEMPKDTVGPLYHWAVVPYGKPDEAVQWHDGEERVMLMPPGEYQVAVEPTDPTRYQSQRLVWPQKVQVQPDQVTTVKLDSGVRIEMPKDTVGPLYHWAVVPYGKPDEVIQYHGTGERVMLVPPGEYQVAVEPTDPTHYQSQRLVWPQKVQVQPDQVTALKLDSGVRIEMPKDAVGPLYHWAVVPYGKPDEVIQYHGTGERVMLVPPGEYQVAVEPTDPTHYQSQRLVWPQKVQVQPDQVTTLKLDSGVRIEMPKDAVGPLYHWAVVPYGKPDEVIQYHGTGERVMLVPPGEYQVAVEPTETAYGGSQRLVWPLKVQVQPDQVATLKLDSGIRLSGPAGAKPDFRFRVLDAKKATVQWGGHTWGGQLIPPGTYSVEIRATEYQPWKTLGENVVVRPSQITEVKVPGLPQ